MPSTRSKLDRNKTLWNHKRIVRHYQKARKLFPSEETILARLGSKLGEMDVLDLGVGGGRTAHALAPISKTYVGIDIASKMVEACAATFAHIPTARFATADARHLDALETTAFDFVLFSYNGIDYLDMNDRLLALAEIRRVLRPEGQFLFSTHNLQWIESVLATKGVSLRSMIKRGQRTLIRKYNADLSGLGKLDATLANDGAHGGSLNTYYIRPRAQITQLQAAGFTDVEAMDAKGRTISEAGLDLNSDPWVHYLCH